MKTHQDYQFAFALVILAIVLLLVLASGVFVIVKYHNVIISPTPYLMLT